MVNLNMKEINDYVGCYILNKHQCGRLRVDTTKALGYIFYIWNIFKVVKSKIKINRLAYMTVPKRQKERVCKCYRRPEKLKSTLFNSALRVVMENIHYVDFCLPYQLIEDVFIANFDSFGLFKGMASLTRIKLFVQNLSFPFNL